MLRATVPILAMVLLAAPTGAQEAVGEPPVPAAPAEAARPDGGETPAAASRRAVLDELEALRAEIAMLKALRAAQRALFAWNGLRVKSGERPAALERVLCERVGAWCAVLPASFGRGSGGGSE